MQDGREAAQRCQRRRRRSALTLACGLMATLAAAPTVFAEPNGSDVRAATAPLQNVGTGGVRLRVPVDELASDGNRVAYRFCRELIAVWKPGTRTGSRIGPAASFTCPTPHTPRLPYSLTLSGHRLAWATNEGGIQSNSGLWLVQLAQPARVELVAYLSGCCRGDPLGEGRFGYVVGQRGLLAFSRWQVCGDIGAPPCPAGTPRKVIAATLQRILKPPASGNCLGRPWPCRQIGSEAGMLEPLSAHSGRVAVRLPDGSLRVVSATGATLLSLPGLAGLTHAAELWKRHLVVLSRRNLLHFDVTSGRRLHSWPVPTAFPGGGGHCGRIPCRNLQFRLEDLAHGRVAYVQQNKVHVLRLRDGRDVVVANGTTARFVDSGLVYAYETTGAWPGGVHWIPLSRLP
jgi:hypothetical protein